MQDNYNEYYKQGNTTRRNFLTVENNNDDKNSQGANSPRINLNNLLNINNNNNNFSNANNNYNNNNNNPSNNNNILDIRNLNFFDKPTVSEGNLRDQRRGSKRRGQEDNDLLSLASRRKQREQLEEEDEDNNPSSQDISDKMQDQSKNNHHNNEERRNGISVNVDKKKSMFNDLIFQLRMKNKARKLANSINSRMHKNLTLSQFIMIGDKASNKQYLLKNNYTYEQNKNSSENENIEMKRSIIYQFLSKIDTFLPVFDPRSTFKQILEVLNLLSIVLIFYTFCIIISFKLRIDTIISSFVLEIALGIIFMNSFVNLNTGFYQDMSLQRDHQKMFRQYYKTHFYVDLFSSLSILLLFILDKSKFLLDDGAANSQQSVIEVSDTGTLFRFMIFIPFFFKLRDFAKFMITLEEKVNFKKQEQNIVQLVKLFSSIILIDHIMACLWICSSKLSFNYEVSWQTKKDYQLESWFRQYTLSFYYSTVTMTTVGYGDITPTNQTETIICIFMMLISSGVFGFTLNQIGMIFSELQAETKETRIKLNTINRYMEKKNLNYPLRTQIRQYLEYVWRENNEKLQQDSTEIIDQLNEQLKMELQYHQNEKIINYFKKHYNPTFMQKAMTLIKEVQCKPQQVIYKAGQTDDMSLYLVEKGKVEVFYKTKPIPKICPSTQFFIHEINEGQLFGIRQFYTGLPRDLNIRAVGFVTLLRVSRDDFMKLLEQYPDEKETFCYIRDNITLYQDGFKSNSACPACGSFKHHLIDCNTIHYVPHQQNVCLRHNYIPKKNWEEIERRKLNIRKTLDGKPSFTQDETEQSEQIRYHDKRQTFYDLSETVEQYYLDNEELIEEYENAYLSYDFDYNYINKKKEGQNDEVKQDDQQNQQLDENGQPISYNNDEGSLNHIKEQLQTSQDQSAMVQFDQISDFNEKQLSFSNQLDRQDSYSEYSPRQRKKLLSSPKRMPIRRDSNLESKPIKQPQSSLVYKGSRKFNSNNPNSTINNIMNQPHMMNSPSVRNTQRPRSIVFSDSVERQQTASDFSKQLTDVAKDASSQNINNIQNQNNVNNNNQIPQLIPVNPALYPIQNNSQSPPIKNIQSNTIANHLSSFSQTPSLFQNQQNNRNIFPINEEYQPQQNLILTKLSSSESIGQQHILQAQLPQLQHFSSVQHQPSSSNFNAIGNNLPNIQLLNQTSFDRTGIKRALSMKMRKFQNNILHNLEKLFQKNNINSKEIKKQMSQVDETDAQYGLQQIFRNFDKQKNFVIYFPLNNLTYLLMKRESKSLIKKNVYLDILQQQSKKKQILNHQSSSSQTLFRQKFADKSQQQSERFLKSNLRGNSSQYSKSKQDIGQINNNPMEQSMMRKSAFYDKNHIESPLGSLTDRQFQFLNAVKSPSANNINISNNNINNNNNNIEQKASFNKFFSRNNISLVDINQDYMIPPELSPNIQDQESNSNHAIHLFQFTPQNNYFNSNL